MDISIFRSVLKSLKTAFRDTLLSQGIKSRRFATKDTPELGTTKEGRGERLEGELWQGREKRGEVVRERRVRKEEDMGGSKGGVEIGRRRVVRKG